MDLRLSGFSPFLLLLALTASGAGSAVVSPHPGDEIEVRAPSADAPALTVFQSESRGGLRYTWVVPAGYDGHEPRDLTVICHGTGLDYRWGTWNNKPGIFRPDDLIVSVDGPSPGEGDTRLFLGEKKDAQAFAAFLEELRGLFSVRRVFLYGHSQGGFFVVYYAGEYPDTVAGVVAHASGAWNWSRTDRKVQRVAIAFMHGTADPVVPYRQSPGARDAYREAGFPLLHLRRLQSYNHWPNAVRATECLDWCEGMTTDSPEEALACAERLVTPKKADEYQWVTGPDFAGARAVLRRFEPQGTAAFERPPEELARRAADLARRIEEAGARHVEALRAVLGKKAEPGLEHAEVIGHLVPLREDFRGVDSVEAFVKELDYDKKLRAQAKSAEAITRAWYGSKDERKTFEAVVENIGKACLVEGYPPELAKKMEAWRKDAAALGIKARLLDKAADFDAWSAGWKQGLEAYEALWRDWKGP